MAQKSKIKAAAKPRRTASAKAKPANKAPLKAPVPMAASPKAPRRKGALILFLLLVVGVAVQGYFLWKKDQRSKMVINFVNELAPNGRDQQGAFCCARCMSVDHKGNVYVLEEPEVGHRLQKFSPAGKFLAIYQPVKGKPDQALVQGYGMASDSKDDLYVLEANSGKVKVFSPELKYKRQFDVPTNNCNGLVINSKDELIIGDREKSVLLVVSTDGEVIRKMDGGKVRLGGPFRMALAPDDSIWVFDLARGMNNDPDIKGYTSDGSPIAHWTVKDFPANPYNYIGYHPAGYLMVNDNRGNSLGKGFYFYNLKGKLVGNAAMTNNAWVFKNISGFVTDPKTGDIFVNTNFIGRGGDRFTWSPDAEIAK